jgi:hypothetical protein
MGRNTLITDAEKADVIAGKFAESHNNAMISLLANLVQSSCSALLNNDASTYTGAKLRISSLTNIISLENLSQNFNEYYTE